MKHSECTTLLPSLLQKVLILPGVLERTNFGEEAMSNTGVPLGDLLQWADLVAALHVLGHNVTVIVPTSDVTHRYTVHIYHVVVEAGFIARSQTDHRSLK